MKQWKFWKRNETMEIGGRSKSKYKFVGIKVCEVDEVTEYFINPGIENEALG